MFINILFITFKKILKTFKFLNKILKICLNFTNFSENTIIDFIYNTVYCSGGWGTSDKISYMSSTQVLYCDGVALISV